MGTRGVQESQVSILWNCGLWAHHVVLFFIYNRSSDILHGHDSKACQRVPCQLCGHQHWYQGRGTKRTAFLLVERGGPIGKVLVHRWLPECHHNSNKVLLTELYIEVFAQAVDYYCLYHIDHRKGLNKPMEGK